MTNNSFDFAHLLRDLQEIDKKIENQEYEEAQGELQNVIQEIAIKTMEKK